MSAPVSAFPPGILAESAAARVSLAHPCGRLSLRTRDALAPFDAALGLSLPDRIGACASNDALRAICLGPDEWMIHAPETETGAIMAACRDLSDAHSHSLVDVSNREVSLIIDGPLSTELLAMGCPRDPQSIKVGEGRRTLFDGVTVILWRETDTRYRMDVWHSFAPFILHLVETGCRELARDAA